MYAYEGICIAMHGYVHVRQFRAVYGYVWLCTKYSCMAVQGGLNAALYVSFYLLRINVFCSLVLCIMCRQLVSTLCNFARSIGFSVFLHMLGFRFHTIWCAECYSCDRLRATNFYGKVYCYSACYCLLQELDQSSIFILRFILQYCFFELSIYFTLLVFYIVASLFLVLRSYSTLYLGQFSSYSVLVRTTKLRHHKVTKLYQTISSYLYSSYSL